MRHSLRLYISGLAVALVIAGCSSSVAEPTATPIPSFDIEDGIIYPVALSNEFYIHMGNNKSEAHNSVKQEWWIYKVNQDSDQNYRILRDEEYQIIEASIELESWDGILEYHSRIEAHPDWYITLEDLNGDEKKDIRLLYSNSDGQWLYHAYLWDTEIEQFVQDENFLLEPEIHEENK